jgi:UTP--glucose-1-phosphate uridylyltransferase
MRSRTAVIPAAGLGTRFYPVTKAVPKELLPIVDVPVLQLVMDEAIAAGAEHIVLVSHVSKTPVEAYVAPSASVIEKVRASGREDLANRLARIGTDVRVSVVYQDTPRGLGHAVGCARSAVGDEPFSVLLPDEIMGDATLLNALVDSCEKKGVGAVGLMRVPMEQVSAYGVITPSASSPDEGPYDIVDVVEKPAQADAPSNLIIIGRYVLTPDVFEEIDTNNATTAIGTIEFIDKISKLNSIESSCFELKTGVDNYKNVYSIQDNRDKENKKSKII